MRSLLLPAVSSGLGLLMALTACADASVESKTGSLPGALAVRGDLPYIAGTIIDRTTRDGRTRILVRSPRDATTRVPEAIVNVTAGATILWSDGSPAAASDLRARRNVTVWITGPELRSLPPQVSGEAFLLKR
jgi:hypothetical protein